MSELPKIDILMATYNGEKYIREQIESLQNQSYRNWTLLISDDGSTDNTLAIVEEMQKKTDHRIEVAATLLAISILQGASSLNFPFSVDNTLSDQGDFFHFIIIN